MRKIAFILLLIFNSVLYADTEIFKASKSGNNIKINQLLSEGVNINEHDTHKRTPLFEAISWGKIETVKLLISKGASVIVTDAKGNTPLHAAAFLGHLDIVKLLLSHNAQINEKNNDGQTALHLAASGQIRIVEYLLKNGAQQKKDKYGNSVLDLASSEGIKHLLVGSHSKNNCTTCKSEKKDTFRKITDEKSYLEDAMYSSEVGSPNSLNNKIILLKKDYSYSVISGWSGEADLIKVTLNMKNTTNKDIFSTDVFVAYYDNKDAIINVTRKTVYTIKANNEFEVDSSPSSFSRKAKTAFVVFVLVNSKPES